MRRCAPAGAGVGDGEGAHAAFLPRPAVLTLAHEYAASGAAARRKTADFVPWRAQAARAARFGEPVCAARLAQPPLPFDPARRRGLRGHEARAGSSSPAQPPAPPVPKVPPRARPRAGPCAAAPARPTQTQATRPDASGGASMGAGTACAETQTEPSPETQTEPSPEAMLFASVVSGHAPQQEPSGSSARLATLRALRHVMAEREAGARALVLGQQQELARAEGELARQRGLSRVAGKGGARPWDGSAFAVAALGDLVLGLRLRLAFSALRAHGRLCALRRALCHERVLAAQRGLLAQSWAALKAQHARNSWLRERCRLRAASRRAASIGRVFVGWAEAVRDAQLERGRELAAAQLWRHKALWRALLAWRATLCVVERHAELLELRAARWCRQRALSRAFDGWCDVYQRSRALRLRLLLALRGLRGQLGRPGRPGRRGQHDQRGLRGGAGAAAAVAAASTTVTAATAVAAAAAARRRHRHVAAGAARRSSDLEAADRLRLAARARAAVESACCSLREEDPAAAPGGATPAARRQRALESFRALGRLGSFDVALAHRAFGRLNAARLAGKTMRAHVRALACWLQGLGLVFELRLDSSDRDSDEPEQPCDESEEGAGQEQEQDERHREQLLQMLHLPRLSVRELAGMLGAQRLLHAWHAVAREAAQGRMAERLHAKHASRRAFAALAAARIAGLARRRVAALLGYAARLRRAYARWLALAAWWTAQRAVPRRAFCRWRLLWRHGRTERAKLAHFRLGLLLRRWRRRVAARKLLLRVLERREDRMRWRELRHSRDPLRRQFDALRDAWGLWQASVAAQHLARRYREDDVAATIFRGACLQRRTLMAWRAQIRRPVFRSSSLVESF